MPRSPRAGINTPEEARLLRLTTPAELNARHSGRHGARALTKALHAAGEPSLTRSEAERRFLDLIRAARLPTPETNVRIAGYEVDFLWRDRGVVVEVDGFAYHSSREAFERDRRKDAVLQARGLRTTRVTYRQIAHESTALVATLAVTIHSKTAI